MRRARRTEGLADFNADSLVDRPATLNIRLLSAAGSLAIRKGAQSLWNI